MTVNVQRLGPGTLTLGAGPLAVQAQLTGCKVVPAEAVDTEEAVKVLSGEVLAASDTASYTFTLQGTYLQDLLTAGLVAWTWTNKGTNQNFTFKPNGSVATIAGVCQPVPLQVGGDEVGLRMDGSFTWRIIGTPTPTWV